jgi:hypothetical protein
MLDPDAEGHYGRHSGVATARNIEKLAERGDGAEPSRA